MEVINETITITINTMLIGGTLILILGCVLGYCEKCIQIRVDAHKERLLTALTNTIKDNTLGDFPFIPNEKRYSANNNVLYLKGTETE